MLHRLVLGFACLVALSAPAVATPIVYSAFLSGPNESPANASPGTGTAQVTIDAAAHTMMVLASFQNLTSANTAAHIHVINGPGDADISDTVGPVSTTTPTFTGFPSGVTAGTFANTFDMTLASSYRAGFVTDSGGIAAAELALFSAIATGRAYFNIHTTINPGGEIRGFLQPVPEPATLLLMSAGLGALLLMRRRRQI
jgi:hypothetical protein